MMSVVVMCGRLRLNRNMCVSDVVLLLGVVFYYMCRLGVICSVVSSVIDVMRLYVIVLVCFVVVFLLVVVRCLCIVNVVIL